MVMALGKAHLLFCSLRLFKGHCDALLSWQFTEKVAMMILVQIMFRILWTHSDKMHIYYHGYNLRVRIYMNGDGLGKGTVINVLFFSDF